MVDMYSKAVSMCNKEINYISYESTSFYINICMLPTIDK